MKIIFAGDKHLRSEYPHYEANKKYYEWFASQDFNSPDNVYIDLGDHFHRPKPSPDEYELFFNFVGKLKFKNTYWLSGNHDYSHDRKTSSLDPLRTITNASVISQPMELFAGGVRVFCLPFEYSRKGNQDYYTDTLNEFNHQFKEGDILSYHFPDETQPFGGIDLSAFKGRRIAGDIHLQSENYIGVPFPTRRDERGQQGRILIVDSDSGEIEVRKVPRFLDYSVVQFGHQPAMNSEGETVIHVYDAPSYKEVASFYKDYRIDQISFRKVEAKWDGSEIKEVSEDASLKQHLENFIKENGVESEVASELRNRISL